MKWQITLEEYLNAQKRIDHLGCGNCACQSCLYWWSSRCPYGVCYDDHRAAAEPYDKSHPDKPPRTAWSNWNNPGEQAHWCRGGIFYSANYCDHFVKYTGQQVNSCIKSNVSVFQDGYIQCSIIDTVGCEACYRELEEKLGEEQDPRKVKEEMRK